MSKTISDVLGLIQRIHKDITSLDMLLEFEKTLDNTNLYAYENWFEGELVDGPNIDRYWFSCTWMYPLKKMPDPRGGLRLIKYGCKVYFKRDVFVYSDRVLDKTDIEYGKENIKKARERKDKVWLVTIKMPRRFVDDAYEGILSIENEEIDFADINAAWDEDLDDTKDNNNKKDRTEGEE